jgi:serine/threonine protein kinase/Tfp pilus assembly protein PilF
MSEELLFEQAVNLPSADRAAFLDRECAGNLELRQHVEALLAADAKSNLTVDSPVNATESYVVLSESSGAVIAGRYTLVEPIGEGGMGEVWVAKQSEPVKRKVALKLIKAGMDSKAVIQRFEQERQALALMDHPNIAKVLDGGLTVERRPFFVMELVSGLPLTRFCDEAKLGVRARLELFVPICQAVQHAHQKGIIHRDLKPSNILVTIIDGRGVPKVIDFGVAKATSGRLTDESLSTQFGAVVGTLEYMSPEQAGYSAADVDTRADIYSLGVILYELLTGLKPIDASRLRQAAMTEMIRIIKEEEPSKPSTRLSTDDAAPSLAALRHTEPKKLAALLRGELDWVIMKCLEKQRDRRYETANGLARDIQRYLADEPVEARPPSAGYRLSKFLRRNRGPVIAASLLFLALVAGVIGTSWGMWRANQSAEAERRAKQDAVTANEQTQKRLVQIEKGVALFAGMLTGINPHNEKPDGPTVYQQLRERAEKAANELDSESVGDPLAVARLQSILGETLRELGNYSQAIAVLEKARATQAKSLGADHPVTLTTMSSLATGYQFAGQFDKALPLLEETLSLRKSKLGAGHADTLESMNNLASGYESSGQLNKAIPLYEEVLQLTKDKKGTNHADTLTTMNNLAKSYSSTGQLDKALPLHEETLRLRKSNLGADHVDTLKSMNDLAITYDSMGQCDKALQQWEETLRLTKKKLGADHPDTRASVNNLATAYQTNGQLDKALPLLEDNLRYCKSNLGDDHPNTLTSMNNLALAYLEGGQTTKALRLLEESVRLSKAKLGADHPDTLKSMNNLAACYLRAGKPELAAPLVKHVLPEARKAIPKESTLLAQQLATFGMILLKANAFTEAEPLLRESLAIRENQEPDDWRTFNTKSMLGGALLGQKKYAEAEPLLLKGYDGMKTREKTIPPQGSTRIPEALDRLIELYTATKKPDDLRKWQAERVRYSEPNPSDKK